MALLRSWFAFEGSKERYFTHFAERYYSGLFCCILSQEEFCTIARRASWLAGPNQQKPKHAEYHFTRRLCPYVRCHDHRHRNCREHRQEVLRATLLRCASTASFMTWTRPIDADVAVEIITRDSDDGLELLRHDAAHVLAEAVKELWPDTQVTIGPAIENGFYYDFARDEPFTEDDLEVIEKRMQEIVDRDENIAREEWDRDKAVEFFRGIGEEYKAEIIASIPDAEAITLYRQGDFIDLCRGPHLPSTGKLGKAFKLTRVSGAYWRGDSNNEMLQRVYGTAWANDKQLRKYLLMLEEAEKRDHRRLGKIMDLFHFQEEAPGAVFWHPERLEPVPELDRLYARAAELSPAIARSTRLS